MLVKQRQRAFGSSSSSESLIVPFRNVLCVVMDPGIVWIHANIAISGWNDLGREPACATHRERAGLEDDTSMEPGLEPHHESVPDSRGTVVSRRSNGIMYKDVRATERLR
jgi:hypothetical protein